MQTRLFIGGEFVTGEGVDEDILNPATGELIVKIPSASKGQIDKAVASAARAFLTGAARRPASARGCC